MKKIWSALLALTLAFGSLLCLPVPARAEEPGGNTGFGHYGMRFWIGSTPIEPQANIYRMVLDALSEDPAAGQIELEWEATPLHFSTYLRDEALAALRLDHPELDLAGFSITKWDSRMVANYVARLSLTLKREKPRPPEYAAGLRQAMDLVAAAPAAEYEKARAAFSWLTENCSLGGGSSVEQLFGTRQGDASAFASAFQLLMTAANVECVLGYDYTFGRTWNYVKIGGKWYVVDLDRALSLKSGADTSYCYRYFLCGDDRYTQRENFPDFMRFLGRGSQLSPVPEAASCPYEPRTYTVTLADAANGTVTARLPSGQAVASGGRVPAGSSLEVTLVPDAGYDKQVHPQPSAPYLPASGEGFTWTLPNIHHDLVLDGYFSDRKPQILGTFSFLNPSSGGSITLYDAWNQRSFQENVPLTCYNVSEMHVQFLPAAGWHLERVLFKTWAQDGGADPIVGSLSGGGLPEHGELVLSGKDITPYSYVTAEFAEDTQPRSVRVSWTAEHGTLYAAEGATGNAIENSGLLPLGGDLALTLVPDSGYHLESLTANGSAISQKPDASGKLTLPAVREDTVLNAVFSKAPVPPAPPSGGGDSGPETPVPETPAPPEVTVHADGSADITVSQPGTPQTVRVPVSGWTPGMAAVLIYPDGTEKLLKKAVEHSGSVNVTLDRTAKVVFRDLTPSFSDTAGHWAAPPIAFAAAHQLFQGTGPDSFSPEQSMTRAMLAAVLHRLEDSPQAAVSGVFPDTPGGAYYSKAAEWAYETGIVRGSGGKFLPGSSVTRQELAAMVYRYAGAFGLDTSQRASLNGFADEAACASWARDALSWAVAAGLLQGRENSALAPGGTATRAEVAAILQRLLEYAAR